MARKSTNGRAVLAPAPLANRRAEKHGAYVTRFTPAELDEVRTLEARLRDLTPLDSEAIEPAISLAAGQMWRRDRLFRDLERHGVIRGRADRGRVAPAVAALAELERQLADSLKMLCLTPQSAASLNLTLSRARGSDRFDASRLSRDEQIELDRLLEKARAHD